MLAKAADGLLIWLPLKQKSEKCKKGWNPMEKYNKPKIFYSEMLFF